MNAVEGIGYLAASLVLATFCMKSMDALRLAAIASNMAFIAYGYFGHLAPGASSARALATDKHLPARGAGFAGCFEMSEKGHLQRWKGVQPVWELSEAP